MASGGVEKKWQQIEEEITCSICGDLFTDPKTIPCLHTFCKQCIEKSIESNKKMASIVCCPLCRIPLSQDNVSSIPTNFTINRLVEIFGKRREGNTSLDPQEITCSNCEDDLPAVTWCMECENGLCQQCNDAHQRMKAFKYHKTVMVSGNSELSVEIPEVCKNHGKPLDLYCKTCSGLICRDCTLKDHPLKVHDFDFADKVVHDEQEKIKEATVSIKRLLKRIRNRIKRIEGDEKDIATKSEANKKKIQDVYGKVSLMLKQQQQEALKKVDTIKTSLQKTLAMEKETAKLIETQLVSCEEFYTDVISTNVTSQLLIHRNSITDRVEDLTKQVKHASNDPECRADDMIVTYVKPVEFISDSLCDVSGIPHLPHCNVRGPLEGSANPVKVTVTLKDIHGYSVAGQSKVLEIRCSKGKNFLQNLRVEEKSKGVYHICYNPTREDHTLSVYWQNLAINHVEVEIGMKIRDYASITEVARVIERYGPFNLQIVCPHLMAKGLNNKIIVRDNATDHVIVLDEDGRYLNKIGGTGNGRGRFRNVTGMAVDNKGYLYVGDHTLHCIQKLTLSGQFCCQFGGEGTKKGQFKIPIGLLFSKSQLLFICDSENHRIQVFSNDIFSYTFGQFGNQPGYFNIPTDLALNSNEDRLFITDNLNNRVQVFTPHGRFLKIFGNFSDIPFKLQNPIGIFYTPDNHLLITSYSNTCMFVFKEDGQFVSVIEGTYEGKRSKFSCPCGVIMMANGQIVIASVNTHRLIML